MTLRVYHAPRSRSSGALWMLEELGVPYEITLVDIRRGDGSGKLDQGNLHPHGKVPVIDHDGAVVHEQAAIALYLTDAFPDGKLGPRVGDPDRASYLTWLAYYCGVLEPSVLSRFMKWDVPRGTAGWVSFDEVLAHLDATLQKHPYIVGERFTAVDTLFGGGLALFLGNPSFPRTPAVTAYAERCISRPAHARALAKDGG